VQTVTERFFEPGLQVWAENRNANTRKRDQRKKHKLCAGDAKGTRPATHPVEREKPLFQKSKFIQS